MTEDRRPVDEQTLTITECEVLGKLPDPFLREDGTRVATAAQWQEQRKFLMRSAVELQYGTLPQPEFLTVEALKLTESGDFTGSYCITTGTRACPVRLYMRIFLPPEPYKKPCPVVFDGDLSFPYAFDKAFLSAFLDHGIAVALFDRTELAHDIKNEGLRQGALYRTYPDHEFGAIAAWAWGYSRCVDAVEQLGFADPSCLIATGHSRGGKTAMLAGALDERFSIVNPNETCACACSCYRVHMKGLTENGTEWRSEQLSDLWGSFPHWMGPGMGAYTEREAELPFDEHFLKALVAPRILFQSEAAHDIWANPVGAFYTSQATQEVYRFLGCEENFYWYYRRGSHFHQIQDLEMLVNLIEHVRDGAPLSERFRRLPFPEPEKIYDWTCPVRED